MDTSKEYILMCERAVEIQKLRCFDNTKTFESHDAFALLNKVHDRFGQAVVISEPTIGFFSIASYIYAGLPNEVWNNENAIWLPRTDQLEMMWYDDKDEDNATPLMLVINLKTVMTRTGYAQEVTNQPVPFKTLEQWMLAMLMAHRFSKRWDSEKQIWYTGPQSLDKDIINQEPEGPNWKPDIR